MKFTVFFFVLNFCNNNGCLMTLSQTNCDNIHSVICFDTLSYVPVCGVFVCICVYTVYVSHIVCIYNCIFILSAQFYLDFIAISKSIRNKNLKTLVYYFALKCIRFFSLKISIIWFISIEILLKRNSTRLTVVLIFISPSHQCVVGAIETWKLFSTFEKPTIHFINSIESWKRLFSTHK